MMRVGNSRYYKIEKINSAWFYLSCVFVLGLFLRFYNLVGQSYWMDEIYSIWVSSPEESIRDVFSWTVSDVHPPFYQVFLWLWFNVFGYTEYVGRVLSAVVGSMAIIAIYFLGKEIFNREVGIYASAILSINVFAVQYSQEVRSYSFLLFLSALSVLYYFRFFRTKSFLDFLFYTVSTVLLVNTHFFGHLVLGVQGIWLIYFLVASRGDLRKVVSLVLLALLVISLSIAPYIQELLRNAGKDSFWIEQPGFLFFLHYFSEYFQSGILFGVGFLLMMVGFFCFFDREQKGGRLGLAFLFSFIFLGYFIPYCKGFVGAPVLTPRNTIFLLPAIFLILGFSISVSGSKYFKAATLFVISVCSILAVYDYHSDATRKQQWRQVIKEVAATSFTGYDLVFSGRYFKAYSEMLGYELEIYDKGILQSLHTSQELPKCFWILDAHGTHLEELDFDIESEYSKVFTITRQDARGSVYSRTGFEENCRNALANTGARVGLNKR